MKKIPVTDEPVNVLFDKERSLYLADFDYRQTKPRVIIGSTWVGEDKRHDRFYLFRVVDMGYRTSYSQDDIVKSVRQNPDKLFREADLEYFCRELVYLHLLGELTKDRQLIEVYDQPTVLRTVLRPTRDEDHQIIAAPDLEYGFAIGHLRNGNQTLDPVVTLEDRFVGFRTLICGASGFGKSTLVRNVGRFWLEDDKYGVIIDDLKGEYVRTIKNEYEEEVPGLIEHPFAKERIFLLTSSPRKYQDDSKLQGRVIALRFDIDDIPPDGLSEVATHLTDPQRQFLEMYGEKPGLFKLLLRENDNGTPVTHDWHTHFREFIIATKEGRARINSEDYIATDLDDFQRSSYVPIFGVRKHLMRLVNMPFVNTKGESCLPRVRELLKNGATIVLDKNGLTDTQRIIVSTVLANDLYLHNERYSSGNSDEQKEVIRFVYLVEEAHLLLSQERVRDGSVFVNFAKTGRSFQIGLVAVTQRPSSIDTNILSQFDNFITFRLTNSKDVDDLIRAKSDFNGYESEIRTMGRGMAVTAFGEPTRVQSIKVFSWTVDRAGKLLSEEQKELLDNRVIPK